MKSVFLYNRDVKARSSDLCRGDYVFGRVADMGGSYVRDFAEDEAGVWTVTAKRKGCLVLDKYPGYGFQVVVSQVVFDRGAWRQVRVELSIVEEERMKRFQVCTVRKFGVLKRNGNDGGVSSVLFHGVWCHKRARGQLLSALRRTGSIADGYGDALKKEFLFQKRVDGNSGGVSKIQRRKRNSLHLSAG